MRRVLIVLLALALLATPALAASTYTYSKTVSATDANTEVSFGAPAVVVEVVNDGANPAFVEFAGAATSTAGIQINACEGRRFVFATGQSPSLMGVIASSGQTATVRVLAIFNTGLDRSTTQAHVEYLALGSSAGCAAYTTATFTGVTVGSTYGTQTFGTATEAITLDTGGSTTDSTANLLPANSIIDGVACRVTTAITVATGWQIGDATVAARFLVAQTTYTANFTAVGLSAMFGVVSATNAGPTQAAAAKLRVTVTGTPGAGALRCTVFYRTLVAPAS